MKFFTEMLYDTQHGIEEFHFERIGNPSTIGYHVAVIAGTDPAYDFIMQEREGKWRITDASSLPAWIVAIEDVLSDSICAHLTKSLA